MKSFLILALAFIALQSTVDCIGIINGGGLGLGLLALKTAFVKGAVIGHVLSNANRRSGYKRGNYHHGRYSHSHGYSSNRRRWGRSLDGNSVEEENVEGSTIPKNLILQAEFQDSDDCAKMFICKLNTKPENELGEVEHEIKNVFGTNENEALDVKKASIRS